MALLLVASNLLEAAESGYAEILVTIDSLAAFNTIDHLVLEWRLEHMFSVEQSALSWIKSYVTVWSCLVKVISAIRTIFADVISVYHKAPFWVRCYSSCLQLNSATSFRRLSSNSISNNMQICFTVNSACCSKKALNLAGCTNVVCEWLFHIFFALNPGRSEIAMFQTVKRLGALQNCQLLSLMHKSRIPTVKNLDLTFDSCLSFNKQVNNISWVCFFHIGRLLRFLAAMST